jgi:hypothetical protein
MHVSGECYVLSNRRADYLSRVVPRIVVCLSVIAEPDRVALGALGLSTHGDDDYDDDDDDEVYSFCLTVEASDHGYVLHTRRIHVTQYRIRYDKI